MALLAVVLCASFAACSDDDDESNGGMPSGSGLKLSSFTWDDGRWDDYSYDAQGRVNKVERYDETGKFDESINFEYNDNKIIATSDGGYRIVCFLNSNGQIEKTACTGDYSTETCTYTYDGNGHLTSINEEDGESYPFIWENDNLVRIDNYRYYDGYGMLTFKYTSIPSSKGLFIYYDDFLIDIFSDVFTLPLLANLGYFGKVPQNMLESITYTDKSSGDAYVVKYSYELGKDGYVSKISGEDDGETTWVKLTWK